MKCLIDADILLYRFGYRSEFEVDWDDDGNSESYSGFEEAITDTDAFLEEILQATYGKGLLLCFTDSEGNFRKEVYPEYKSNRAQKEKPALFYQLKEYLMENYECIVFPHLEADDIMGILATQNQDKLIICTIDKDLKQIPGPHYYWNRMDDGVFYVDEADADWYFYYQILVGDSTDGYGGCPGIGEKRAKRLLAAYGPDDWWKQIVKAYAKKGLTEEHALVQARCARILRCTDWNYKLKRPKLWTPDKRTV